MTKIYLTNKETTASGSNWKGEAESFPVTEGAEVILIKELTYCTKQNKRIDGYVLKNPEKFYQYADNNHYYTVPVNSVAGRAADATLVRAALMKKSDNWQDTADQWRVNIGGQFFDYYTGVGHRINDKPQRPELDGVLHSLIMDSAACEESFEDWCSNFDYSTDSRKALQIYLDCQENAAKLRKAGVDIAAERERLQDY
jgi:hypothetical protein